jgi:hypothetical protein
MKKNDFLLISVKSKKTQSEGQIYVVRREDIPLFIGMHLSPDNVILIDSIETFVNNPES